MLLEENGQLKYNPNEIDIDGHTPLSLCLKGSNSKYLFNFPPPGNDNIFLLLAKHGADVNIVYPEKNFKPAFKEDDVADEDESYDSKATYKCTPLINVVR